MACCSGLGAWVWGGWLLIMSNHMAIPHHDTAGRTPNSPKTGNTIDPMLLPNRGLMSLIDRWLREQRQAFRAAGDG